MNIKYAISDTKVMTLRVIKQMTRSIDTIMTVIFMPIMFLLLFKFILGGTMNLGNVSVADYMLPGIILMCILTGIAYTAFRLNQDVKKGIFERFHSMPISKSSILGGHVLTSVLSNSLSVAVIILIGFLIGFHPQADLFNWLWTLILILLFIAAMTWVSVFFGLISGSPEASSVFSYLLLGLAFVSSAFAPVETMPSALAKFAQHQPMTPIADSMRLLLLGHNAGNDLWISFAWCICIGGLFWILSILVYKKKMK